MLTLEEIAKVRSAAGAAPIPSTATQSLASQFTTPAPKKGILEQVGDFVQNHNLPGAKIGEALGTAFDNAKHLITDPAHFNEYAAQNRPDIGGEVGDIIRSGADVASLGATAPASIVGAAAQYGGLGAAASGGESLTRGNDVGQATKDAVEGGAVGAVAGGAFNLLGKGVNALAEKAGPSALSFTSGVPKAAISQAAENPSVAKQGLDMSVSEVRSKAVDSLNSLYKDLGTEFEGGMTKLKDVPAPENATAIPTKLIDTATQYAGKLGVDIKNVDGALIPDFSKSAIVKPGEKTAVQEALNTISSWDDFSPVGIQKLSTRIGELKNFDESGVTRSSAIVGKIYNAVGDAIKESYPDLASLKTNYATNRNVLDEIQNVLSANKDKPTQIQASVSRLDKLFADNKDEYINVIKQLSERSGVDYLSLLAGGEFQKVLPGFIRGLGGGGAVGVGASVLNPYLLLLAPLFSPRAVGAITRNAPAVARTTSDLVRAGTTQAIQHTIPK